MRIDGCFGQGVNYGNGLIADIDPEVIFADEIMALPLELCLGQLEFLYFLLQIVAIGVELA